ncbi:hypothetical protein MY4824_003701 [Beauveria thailandica]
MDGIEAAHILPHAMNSTKEGVDFFQTMILVLTTVFGNSFTQGLEHLVGFPSSSPSSSDQMWNMLALNVYLHAPTTNLWHSTVRLEYARAALLTLLDNAQRLRILVDFSLLNEEIAFRRRGLAFTLDQYGWLLLVEYNVEIDQFLPWEVVYLDWALPYSRPEFYNGSNWMAMHGQGIDRRRPPIPLERVLSHGDDSVPDLTRFSPRALKHRAEFEQAVRDNIKPLFTLNPGLFLKFGKDGDWHVDTAMSAIGPILKMNSSK